MRNRLTTRRGLLLAAGAMYAVVFSAFLYLEKPGLGIGHFYYVAIILVALATGPGRGGAAGAFGAALYATGVIINPKISPTEVLTVSTAIRFCTYVVVGVVIGYFAERNRDLVGQLQVLADRDGLTGLPNTRAFERAIDEWLTKDRPFSLLVARIDELASGGIERPSDDETIRLVAGRLRHSLQPGDEIARISHGEFAVLASTAGDGDAGRLATHLQRLLSDDGLNVTLGWGSFPRDGSNALSLYRAADERLYARRMLATPSRIVITLPTSGQAASST
jgi:diguanylate cyclase (GGDEF)-like protein